MHRITSARKLGIAPTIGRGAVLTVVFLLLLVPPAWASVFCLCLPETASQQTCHQSVQPEADCESEHQIEIENSSQACHTVVTLPIVEEGQVKSHTRSCCDVTPPLDFEQASLSTSITPITEVNASPLPHEYARRLTSTFAIIDPPRRPPRPFYLTFSCWLI